MLQPQTLRPALRPARANGALHGFLNFRSSATLFNGARFQALRKHTKKVKTILLRLRPVWKIAGPVLKLGRDLTFLAFLEASRGGDAWATLNQQWKF
jgi:hypothetical protein